ncbi:MAG: YutD family protein [Bacilli bacterium]|nr:YutD family protein [Bacilli bacterium]
MITIGDKNFELIENYRECFQKEEFESLFTEYFYEYDYIIGDYAYNKLRLKGFYEDTNKKAKDLNKISNKDKYLEENCAYNCKYFILKKI